MASLAHMVWKLASHPSPFFRWAQRFIWERLLEETHINPDLEAVMIDATIIKAHACSAVYGRNSQKEKALGRYVGGFSSKINAMVDALGNPLNSSFHQVSSNASDRRNYGAICLDYTEQCIY